MGAFGNSPQTLVESHVGLASITLASATTTNGATIDTRGWEGGWVKFTVNAGTFTGSGCTAAITIHHDTASGMGTAAAVTGAAFTDITASNDAGMHHGIIKVSCLNRYIRAVVITSGTVTTCPLAIQVDFFHPSNSASATNTYTFAIEKLDAA